MKNLFVKIIVTTLWILSLTACSHALDDMGLRDDTIYPAVLPVDHPPPPKLGGSLYQPGYEATLYDDRIAHRVGDILTVRLEEVTQGEKKAKIKTSKVTTNDFMTPTILGHTVNPLTFNTNNDQEFDGEGESNQQNKLKGTVSVTVMQVLSNGNMIIQGETWVTIDQGREFIRLTGIVRREDIEANNIVSSQRIAGARMAYSGNGQVGNASRGGLITQFLTKFFPY